MYQKCVLIKTKMHWLFQQNLVFTPNAVWYQDKFKLLNHLHPSPKEDLVWDSKWISNESVS